MATSPTAAATANAIDTHRSSVSRTRRTSGRAISIRSTNSPIADITARNVIQRAMRRVVVAADSEVDGMTNSGAGPGFGPTANVYAPRTGWPSTEITRQ